MNAETGKSSSLSLFLLLGLPVQLSRWGNKVSLLPICTCKQKANHATSLCILKRNNKPRGRWRPWLPARGSLPAGGTGALPRPPGGQECVLSPSRHCGSGLFLPSPGSLSRCPNPGLPVSPAAFPGAGLCPCRGSPSSRCPS